MVDSQSRVCAPFVEPAAVGFFVVGAFVVGALLGAAVGAPVGALLGAARRRQCMRMAHTQASTTRELHMQACSLCFIIATKQS